MNKAAARELTVGLLGGLGPFATLDFMAKVLEATGAERDQDHLHLIVDCNPKVPNRNTALAGTGPSPGPMLAAMAHRLEAAGADFLVMACNSAHAWEADIRAAVRIPLVSIVAETVAEVAQRTPVGTGCGVLAAEGCRHARLYERALEAVGFRAIVPERAHEERFMELLYRIKAGERGTAMREAMADLARGLVDRGAAIVVAGCTELPLVLPADALSVPLIDSTAVLARATVAYARCLRPPPEATAGRAPAAFSTA